VENLVTKRYRLNADHVAGTFGEVKQRLLEDAAFRLEWESRRMAAEIGKLTRKMRKEAGLSQAQLAERMGVSQPFVARMETNPDRVPTLDTVARVAEACGRRMVLSFEKDDPHVSHEHEHEHEHELTLTAA